MGGFTAGEVKGGLFEGGGGAFHAGEAEVPVPTGEVFPAGDGADEEALGDGVGGGHLGLGEKLWNVLKLPCVVNAVAFGGLGGVNGAGYFVFEEDVVKGA